MIVLFMLTKEDPKGFFPWICRVSESQLEPTPVSPEIDTFGALMIHFH